MAHQNLAQYCIFVRDTQTVHSIPQLTVADGSDTDNLGIILRFSSVYTEQVPMSLIAGEDFADSDQQILAYIDPADNTVYACDTWDDTHTEIDLNTLRNRSLVIVDMSQESGAVSATGTLTTCWMYQPTEMTEVKMDMVGEINDIYITSHRTNQYFLPAIEGAIANDTDLIFIPSTLFADATQSGDDTEITAFVGTALSAAIEITDAAQDYTDYAAVGGVAQYAICATYDTGPVGVLGYIGAVADGGSDDYTLDIYTTAALAVKSWAFGGPNDIGNDFGDGSSVTAWYLVPVENAYVGETAVEADDETATAVISFSSELTGIVGFAAALAGATTLFYSKYDKMPQPLAGEGETWVMAEPWKQDFTIGHGIHTISMASASADCDPVISGYGKNARRTNR